MEEKTKIKFEEYGIEFDESEFENLSEEELDECEEIVEEIKKLLEV